MTKDKRKSFDVSTLAILAWALIIRALPITIQWMRYGELVTYHKGGLFYAFIQAIRTNSFNLPINISNYTLDGLPFAYPPLSFYLAALAENLTAPGPAVILLINASFSFAAVLAFVWLAQALKMNRLAGQAALLAFATLPQTFVEHLPGEGLAESVGMFIFILFLTSLFRASWVLSTSGALSLGILMGLNGLTSPGTFIAAPITFLLFAAETYRSLSKPSDRRQLMLKATFAGLVGLLTVTPYLLHVLGNYSARLFVDTFLGQIANGSAAFLGEVLFALMPVSLLIPVWHIAALFGLTVRASRRDIFWILWVIFLALLPREGSWLLAAPVALLAGEAVEKVLIPAFAANFDWQLRSRISAKAIPLAGAAFFAVVVLPLGTIWTEGDEGGSFFYRNYVTSGEVKAMEFLRQSTAIDTTILLFGDENEWAPQITDRPVLNVLYGTEWQPEKFSAIWALDIAVSQASSATELLAALKQSADQYPDILPLPDLLYFSAQDHHFRLNPPIRMDLIPNLLEHQCFSVLYESDAAVIFLLNANAVPC